MLGPPIDAWYVWLGVAMVSLAVLGVVAIATPEPPSTAVAAADTIEEVSASRAPATARHPIDADRVRVTEHRIVVGDDAATLDHGNVTPAARNSSLRRIALGAAPTEVFETRRGFRAAVETGKDDGAILAPAGEELIVRKLTYGGNDVVLVTA